MPRGFTFLEVLVAVAMAMTFLGAFYASFVQLLRVADKNHARLEALRNGRAALMTMTDDIKQISNIGALYVPVLIGLDFPLPYGNGIDDDDDGLIDEEQLNGRDDDGDWTSTSDLHAQFGVVDPMFERFHYTLQGSFGALYGLEQDDLGDQDVDEDCVFSRDSAVFRITPTASLPDVLFRTITYTIGPFDGEQHVLIRQSLTEFTPSSGLPSIISTAPLAFGVLSLDLLYWDPNGDPDPNPSRDDRPYWVATWDSTAVSSFDPPMLPLPASIYTRLEIYVGDAHPNSYVGGELVSTMRVEGIINIEDIIGSVLYPRASI
jgi:type II secretory pathway pseudopilin PulG